VNVFSLPRYCNRAVRLEVMASQATVHPDEPRFLVDSESFSRMNGSTSAKKLILDRKKLILDRKKLILDRKKLILDRLDEFVGRCDNVVSASTERHTEWDSPEMSRKSEKVTFE
jgi:hypothetical protein